MDQEAHACAQQLLLKSVAEELKLPLIQIAREAELQGLVYDSMQPVFRRMQLNADMALKLVDSYLLGIELNNKQATLELEAVSLAHILYDTAHTLNPLAKQYDVKLELKTTPSLNLVMAHGLGLKAALYSLGYTLISCMPEHVDKPQRSLALNVHRCTQGVAIGMYGDFRKLAHAQLKQARALYGQTRQPLEAMGTAAAGVFVADTILQAMEGSLRVSRYRRQVGLGTVLQASKQLALV